MSNPVSTHRQTVSDIQLELLAFMYVVRFVTVDLLAATAGKNRSTLYERLDLLVQEGYLLKQYTKEYRIDGRPASYCLAPRGIRALKGTDYVIESSLLQNYKNKNFTTQQIDECLQLVRLRIFFKKQYGDRFFIFTKYQLERDNFVRPTPLLYVQSKEKDAPDYVIDFIPAGTPTWQIRKRLTMHENFAYDVDFRYPHVVFVTGNANTEKRIIGFTNEYYLGDFRVFTTPLEKVLTQSTPEVFHDPVMSLDFETYETLPFIRLPLAFENDIT